MHSWTIPITLGSNSEIGTKTLLEECCSEALPTNLCSWGLTSDASDGEKASSKGVALGCEDGTVYLFHPTANRRPRSVTQLPPSLSITSTSSSPQIGAHSRSPSRSHVSPFHLSERTGPVSGVSKEQVEAPKNYVDFDEEQEKMKEMVSSRPVRAKGIVDGMFHGKDKNLGTGRSRRTPPLSPRPSSLHAGVRSSNREDGHSYLSAGASPSFTPRSLSPPLTPALGPLSGDPETGSLTLQLHIFPLRFGTGRPVVALKSDDDGSILLSLQENGDLSVYECQAGRCLASWSPDAAPLMTPPESHGGVPALGTWYWKGLHIAETAESFFVMTSASSSSAPHVHDSADHHHDETSRVTVFLLENLKGRDFGETALRRVGDWCVDGPADGVGFATTPEGVLKAMHVNSNGMLVVGSMSLLPDSVVNPPESEHTTRNLSSVNLLLPLPNPFKNLRARMEAEESPATDVTGRIHVEPGIEVRIDTTSPGDARLAVLKGGIAFYVNVWSDDKLSVFRVNDNSLKTVLIQNMTEMKSVALCDHDTLLVLRESELRTYALGPPAPRGENGDKKVVKPEESVLPLGDCASGLIDLSHPTLLLGTRLSHNKRRKIESLVIEGPPFKRDASRAPKPRTLWKASNTPSRASTNPKGIPTITALLPLELNLIIAGYDDGRLRQASLFEFASTKSPTFTRESEKALDASLTSLHLVRNGRTREQVIVSGGDDGSIAFWSLGSLALQTRRILFTTPLAEVLDPSVSLSGIRPPWNAHDETLGQLQGCIFCISEDGTIAVFALDEFELHYMIPGAQASLMRMALGEDNLLLMYSDGRARLWDVRTLEFWRSMSLDKAEELLQQGGWWDSTVPAPRSHPTLLTTAQTSSHSPDSAKTVLLDSSHFFQVFNMSNGTKQSQISRSQLLSLLALFVPPTSDDEIEVISKDKIKLSPNDCIIGLTSDLGSFSIPTEVNSREPWILSCEASASRLVILVGLLRLLQGFPDLERYANTLISYFVVTLPDVMGPSYLQPSLPSLGRIWSATRGELHHAAQTILEARVARLGDEDTMLLVEEWQHRLPVLQPQADKQSLSAALALLLTGFVASEKYNLLSASTLTDISKSIVGYLYDEQSPHRALAVELCSRGFDVWQHYVDAMGVLRALFNLATSSQKDTISLHNIGQLARSAVLQIASGNTPLFMTTLSLDILHPSTVEHRRSIMQLIAFMIRKRPLVLFPNLPRLIEAVVKSLDPASSGNREAVFDTATEILGYVVKTYPTVDFHMGSQRLAVGTSEGPIVMYDLKTATRLYVLEGHKMRPAACSFSPDGRRLVTVSLEEGSVLVWKVGTSIVSFFTPGAPPRQGHSGSEPFKTYPFNVGDEANMTVAATFEWIDFEWVGERSVKLKIRDSVLTFAT